MKHNVVLSRVCYTPNMEIHRFEVMIIKLYHQFCWNQAASLVCQVIDYCAPLSAVMSEVRCDVWGHKFNSMIPVACLWSPKMTSSFPFMCSGYSFNWLLEQVVIADWINPCIHSLAISSEKLSMPRHNSVNAYLWDQWSVGHLRLGQTVMITTGNKKQQHWFKYIIIKVCLDLIRGSVD